MINRSSRFSKAVAALALAALLSIFVAPSIAGAQAGSDSFSTGPTSDQYDPPVVKITGGGGEVSDTGGGLSDPVGPLPFTGFDVIAMVAVALAVTGLGLALQRAVSREPRSLD